MLGIVGALLAAARYGGATVLQALAASPRPGRLPTGGAGALAPARFGSLEPATTAR
ncbi:MAG: hypothetical protein M3O55_07210 [Actinomycetota bacterium]|nr:hypothetical protein [Actinomycetota bacterium]